MITAWPSPKGAELALEWKGNSSYRILILPALLDEANKLRHFTVEVARRIHGSGHGVILPDLPGQNESLLSQYDQTLVQWREAAAVAANHFGATHVLTVRGGAILAPDLPGWRYASHSPSSQLRNLLRAKILSAREAGRFETSEALMKRGIAWGLNLGGFDLSGEMVAQLANLQLQPTEKQREIGQTDIGGAGLWLRPEPAFDSSQADTLAAIVAMELA